MISVNASQQMIKKIALIILAIAVIIGIALVAKPVVEVLWTQLMDIGNPQYFKVLKKRWENKPTDFLINKINHPSIHYSGVATSLLRERVDKSRADKIVKIIQQRSNIRGRGLALSVLFSWDADKATKISMEILRSGTNHPLFQDAMGMLVHRRYGPAFPYLLEMAKQPNGYKNGSVNLLKDFGRAEAIPILEGMLGSVNEKDPTVQAFLKDDILEAIKALKNQNK